MACDYQIIKCAAHWEDSRVNMFEFIAFSFFLSLPQDRETASISLSRSVTDVMYLM